MEVPKALIVHEPDVMHLKVFTDQEDSGLVIEFSGNDVPDRLGLCAVALTPDQALALIEKLKIAEEYMQRECNAGRRGAPISKITAQRDNGFGWFDL